MSRSCRRALHALALLAVPALAFGQDYAETVVVNLVTVDVEARDAQGKPVTDLQRGDFQLFEDGKKVDLTHFERMNRSTVPVAPGAAAPSPAAAPPATGEPVHIVVYVDNLHIHAETRARALRQVRAFVAAGLVPGERVMVASQDVSLDTRLPFSSDPAAIEAALQGLETLPTHGGEDDSTRRVAYSTTLTLHEQEPCSRQVVDPVKSYAEAARDEVLRTLGRLRFLINSLAGLPGRKALLYVSDGIPLQPGQDLFQVLFEICGGGAASSGASVMLGNAVPVGPSMNAGRRGENPDGDSPRAPRPRGDGPGVFDADLLGPGAYNARSASIDAAAYDTSNELRRLAAHASANRVSLYTLQASGLSVVASADSSLGGDSRLLQLPSVASIAADNPKQSLVYLAKETGGRAIVDTNDFARELRRMRENLATYYVLGYQPAHQGDARDHRIEVRVERPGVRLEYRRVYRDKPALEQVLDRTLAALVHGREDNPLAVTIEIGPAQPLANGRFRVDVRLLVPLFKLATITHDDVHEGKLRVMVIAGERGGGISEPRQVEVPVRVPHLQALTAFGQKYAYDIGLELAAGEHTLAFAVRDDLGSTTSFLHREVRVGAQTAATRP